MVKQPTYRIKRALAAIKAGSDNDCMDSDVTDTLANIMHLCAVQGLDFERNLRLARQHFTAEQAGET